MKERRDLDRRALIHHLQVKHRNSGKLIGFLANISEGGLMLLGTDPVESGNGASPLALQVCLPGDFFTASQLLIEAQTVWSLQDEASGLFATGLQFENLSGENGRIVQEIILALGSREDS